MKAISEGVFTNIRAPLLAVLTLAGIGLVPVRADASAIHLNTWYEFEFGGVGSPLGACTSACVPATNAPDGHPIVLAPGPAWTLTTTQATKLVVVDLFQSVDQFEIFDHLAPIGDTTVPTPGGNCGSNITCALGNFDYSRGDFFLSPGLNSLTGTHIAGIPGAAVFEVTTGIPEPSTWAMMLIGFAGLGFAGYRTSRRAV
jgi:PEP-CTERM motif